jgi:F-type H+-transporting ATPase subunit epsilon
MADRKQLHCSIITPERAVLEADATFVAVPLHDGEMGFMPGRAPIVAKLGVGELRVEKPDGAERFLVTGGFVQVLRNEVNVLTSRAVSVEDLTRDAARAALTTAEAMPALTDADFTARQTAIAHARAALRLATK